MTLIWILISGSSSRGPTSSSTFLAIFKCSQRLSNSQAELESSRTAQDLWCDKSALLNSLPSRVEWNCAPSLLSLQWVNAGQNKPLPQGQKKKTFSAVDLNFIKEDKLSPKQYNLQRGALHQIRFYNWPSWLSSPLLPPARIWTICRKSVHHMLLWKNKLSTLRAIFSNTNTPQGLWHKMSLFSGPVILKLWCQDHEQQQQQRTG